MNRREILKLAGNGFGILGAAHALQSTAPANPLAVKAPHFQPKAKRVIFLFLNGGLSQVDTFDPKPVLTKRHGEPMPGPKIQTDRASGNLMGSPFEFRKCGQSGIEVSDIFPKVGAAIDDFCVIRSMYSDNGNHGPSLLMMNSGHGIAGRPALGSWLTYGLGTENENLPGFVALCPGYPVLGPQLWSSGFLPSIYQGTYVRNSETDINSLLPNIRNAKLSRQQQANQLGLLEKLDRAYVEQVGSPELESALASMEVAFRMQTEAPETFDITKEPAKVQEKYGSHDFGRGCLMALRMIEKGVRMVQVYFGNFQPWDSHDDIGDHARLARIADGPIASLVEDLKLRGLFDETLLIVGSEFGRTPMIQNSGLEKVGNGRDHNVHGFTTLLAGGGVKGGFTYGATDEFGFKAVDNRVHVHDLHATVLHLLGFDHTRLTYRYSGRDFRLTDVSGKVVSDILA